MKNLYQRCFFPTFEPLGRFMSSAIKYLLALLCFATLLTSCVGDETFFQPEETGAVNKLSAAHAEEAEGDGNDPAMFDGDQSDEGEGDDGITDDDDDDDDDDDNSRKAGS